jgi:mono/diheme cytochrome c family protein
MKKIFQFMTMIALCLVASSCYKDALPEPVTPATVSYKKDIQNLFNKNCVGCHKGAADTTPNLSIGVSYGSLTTLTDEGEVFVTPNSADESILFKVLKGESGFAQMPPNGALSAYKVKLVEKWINDGALNN